jgi:DNA-binding response OmpR family regulator
LKILIVDDHNALRYILSFDLKKYGYEVLEAKNGEQGIKVAETENPDLILLDVMMPGEEGFKVCRKLKKSDKTKDIPIIFMTAKAQRKDIQEGLQAGALCYMVKPFKFDELLSKIKEVIG